MYQDLETTFFTDLPVRAAATLNTHAEDVNSIDRLVVASPLGSGVAIPIMIRVTEAFDAGGTSVDVQFVQSASTDLTSVDLLASTGVIAYAAGTLGTLYYRLPLFFIPRTALTKRYVGLQVVSLGTFTTGKLSAFIPADEQSARTGIVAVTGLAPA